MLKKIEKKVVAITLLIWKMFKKNAVAAVFLLTMLLPTVSNVSFGIVQISGDGPTVFRLLAVEGDFSGYSMKSGQFLINTLLGFSNWDNSTTNYVSYIHLLSEYGQHDVMDECKPYWRGNSTKANLEYEILNFLASANPEEFVILYYCGEGGQRRLILDQAITAAELKSWLSSGGLPQANVCVILDGCYTGSWIDDGSGGVLGHGRIVLCSSRSDQQSWSWGISLWSWFTGRENPEYDIHVGIIGGIFEANDTNTNGSIDMNECFEFAQRTTIEFAAKYDKEQNPVAYFGIDDVPLVKLPERLEADFTVTPEKPVSNQTILFNASTSEGLIENYTWNFGDTNETTVSTPTITHRYEQPGNYTVTLTIGNSISNSTSKTITVYYITDLNQDGTVNIVDISIVASAYGTKEGDDRYNPIADLDRNRHIDIIDVAMVATDYGKTVAPASEETVLYYDDGIADSGYAPSSDLYTYAVHFQTPTATSYKLCRVKYYIYRHPAPFYVDIRDANLQQLYYGLATPAKTGWFVVDVSSENIVVQEDFYVGIKYSQLHEPELGADTTDPDGESGEGLYSFPAPPNLSSLDWMIRAIVAEPDS